MRRCRQIGYICSGAPRDCEGIRHSGRVQEARAARDAWGWDGAARWWQRRGAAVRRPARGSRRRCTARTRRATWRSCAGAPAWTRGRPRPWRAPAPCAALSPTGAGRSGRPRSRRGRRAHAGCPASRPGSILPSRCRPSRSWGGSCSTRMPSACPRAGTCWRRCGPPWLTARRCASRRTWGGCRPGKRSRSRAWSRRASGRGRLAGWCSSASPTRKA